MKLGIVESLQETVRSSVKLGKVVGIGVERKDSF